MAIIGGGSPFPLPGELTLAHRGVLFLDELPEFRSEPLNALRQPLEDGVVNLARKGGAAQYPCQIILAAAMNPCPCGCDGEYICQVCQQKLTFGDEKCRCGSRQKISRCHCSAKQIAAYRNRISGPVMDRIDLIIRVGSLTAEEKFGTGEGNEDSATIRSRVEAARRKQEERFVGTAIRVNARIPGGMVDRFSKLTPAAVCPP